MKIPLLLLSLLSVVLNVTSAQSPSPAGRPGYFGTAVPNSAATPADTKAADPVVQGGAVAPDKPPVTAQAAKGQGDETELKKTVTLLKTAKEKILTTRASFTKTAPLASAEAALGALKKTDGGGRYHGHRAKAIGKINDAIAELKAGDQGKKADGLLDESIAEVNACEGLVK